MKLLTEPQLVPDLIRDRRMAPAYPQAGTIGETHRFLSTPLAGQLWILCFYVPYVIQNSLWCIYPDSS